MPPSPNALMLRRLVHPLYRRLETDVHPLRYLFAEITSSCNLNCRHCGSDCDRTPRAGELSTEEWLAFFDYLKDAFDVRKLMVVITGGEPFCHPRFENLIQRLRQNQLHWGMVTNGWMLDESRLELITGAQVASVTISLDGMEDSHDWLRGKQGSYQRALNAVKLVAEAPIPLSDVVTCVNPRNLDELDEVLESLIDAGAKAWRLFMIFPKGRARANDELALDDEGVRRLMAWIAARRVELAGEEFEVEFSCEGYFPRALDQKIRNEPYFCRAGISIGSVLADGAIGACPNVSRELVQGNVRTDDFKSVWDERFRPYRERAWMRKGECEECGEWRRCQGNSMHLWDEETGRTGKCYFETCQR